LSRLLPLSLLLGFMYLISHLFPHVGLPPGAEVTMALGFIILAAYVGGEITYYIGLPKLTGYIVIGVLSGPQVLGFLSEQVVADLKLIDSIALSLIAFSAGREMRLDFLKTYQKSIVSITCCETVLQTCGIGLSIWYLSGRWELLRIAPHLRLSLSLVFGLLAMAKSPLTTIALIEETNVRNRFSYTLLGIVVLKDIILIILFTLLMGFLQQVSQAGTVDNLSMFFNLSWKLLGSLAMGVALGWLIILYLRHIGRELGLFIVLVAFLVSEAAHHYGLEPLLLCMAAGMLIENFSPQGDDFLKGLQLSSPLIYTVFFAIAGANLNLRVMMSLWPVVLLLLALRASLSHVGISLGSIMVEDEPYLRRYGWQAMINQAGVALALVTIIDKTIPSIGAIATPVVLGMIAATDFIGPPLFKRVLLKSREVYPDV